MDKSTGKPKGRVAKGVPTGTRMPQPHGGTLVSGAGGGPQPGSGRPPDAFKHFVAELRANPEARDALMRAASDERLKTFTGAWKLISDYDDDKPAEKKQISGKVEVTVRISREGRKRTAG